ncbi:L,D-transpeptidase family protein [Gorillibacterium timonense]|uniref:L,D-transpeptidase family protein n=1 Tax=Gorillibacterium timonense TaxID=1689269 RepID=UPI000AA695C6|nr:L,D-transpeptidase family protein [Gorillibacterium timonense]
MLFAKRAMALILFLAFLHSPAEAAPSHTQAAVPGYISIQIDPLKNKLLIVDAQGNALKSYPIALGTPKTPTPTGDYVVINKYKNWGSGFGTRWIGLNVPWGTYGIHGTNRPHSIGHDASHGCIRMLNKHVEALYELVEIGTKVTIRGHVLGEPHLNPRPLAKGDSGGEVLLLQNRLRGGAYYKGVCNGKFDSSTEYAMKLYEKANDLPIDGVVSFQDYVSLGLVE